MSVRSFRSVFMAGAVAGAALGCYLVSLRVASERAALASVENQIVLAQRDIRLLQTEIGTRGRLAQLERWNVRVLSLSAPTADQILGDKFQLASLIAPQRKPALEAPVVLASAPAPEQPQPLGQVPPADGTGEAGQLLHQAGLKMPEPKPSTVIAEREVAETKPPKPAPAKAALKVTKLADARVSTAKALPDKKKAGEKRAADATAAMTPPVRTAKIDPLAPLPSNKATAKGTPTDR